MIHLRRKFLKSSILGLVGYSSINQFNNLTIKHSEGLADDIVTERYPALPLDLVNEVVGASHGNLDKVKQLVEERPELANATWDWGWGDIETALGAASHMGRRDIAEYLISKGARQDLFSMVMMGQLKPVKAIVETNPGIQKICGPHGITLLQHGRNRLRRKDSMDPVDIENLESTIQYLETIGDADVKPESQSISDTEKEQYIGEYRFGSGERDVFVVNLNMRKMLSIARKGDFGKTMYKLKDHIFGLDSAPSVKVKFSINNGIADSLQVTEPGFNLTAEVI